MRGRNQLRVAPPNTGAGHSARGIGPKRVRQLIAAVHHVVPRRQPHPHALPHGVRHADEISGRKSQDQKRQPGQRYERAAARQPIQRQEQAGEHQRRPHVLLQEKEDQRKGHRNQRGQRIFYRWNIEAAGERGQRFACLARMTQNVPTGGEIPGQEKYQQQADDFHRLEAKQVHLGVAGSRPGPEQHQQHRKRKAGQQRHVAQLAEPTLVVQPAERGQQHHSSHHPLSEIHEQQVVAHRVAQADHENESRARQQQNRRQKCLVAREAAQTPPQVRQQKCRDQEPGPQVECAIELRRLPHHKERLQLAKLLAGEQFPNPADVRKAARSIIDFPRRFLPLAQIRNHTQGRQQFLARAQGVQIEQPLRRQAAGDVRQILRLGLVHQVQPDRYQQARGQRPYQFTAAPPRATARNPPHLGAFYRSTACHRHISVRTQSAAIGRSRYPECKDEGLALESSIHVATFALHTFDLTPSSALALMASPWSCCRASLVYHTQLAYSGSTWQPLR